MIESVHTEYSQLMELWAAVMNVAGPAFILLVVGMLFAMSPFSNILNLVTVPLGYEWSSCPYCPEFTINKIEWAECANCGQRHRTNFGSAKYEDGEKWRFCDSDCLDEFSSPTRQRMEAAES